MARETRARYKNSNVGYDGSPFNTKSEDKKDNKLFKLNKGRFPANLIHDGSEEVMRLFPETNPSRAGVRKNKNTGWCVQSKPSNIYSGHNDSGSAARFFYCAKASKEERGEGNIHPTVKPVSLLEYLVRLTKMPNEDQIYLDPFIGSGTTAIAVKQHQRNFIGFELNEEYVKIANARISKVQAKLF